MLSCVRLFAALWTAAHQAPLSSTISWSLLKFIPIEWSGESEVKSISRVRLFATPWTVAHQAPLSSTISWSLCKLMSIDESYLVMSSNHLILCHPLLLLPSIFPSIRVFSKDLALCIRWPKYWSFSISFSNEYSGLILLRIDWFDLLAVQGTCKSLLQHHSWKASNLQCIHPDKPSLKIS